VAKNPENLTKRGGMWRFQRRVPKAYLSIVGRADIQISTGVKCADDPRGNTASKRAAQINRDLEAHWELLATGKDAQAHQFWADAQAAVRKMKIAPLVDDSLQRTVDDAVRRALALHGVNFANGPAIESRAAVAAAFDVVPRPGMTFEACAKAYIAANESGWKNPKHRDQWKMTVLGIGPKGEPAENDYCKDIRSLDVAVITNADVLKIIQPIWATKHETARRIRGRIETILDWAKENKYRSGDNPAALKGNFQHSLPASTSVHIPTPHPALPFVQIPAFMTALRKREGVSARALETLILCGVRTDAIIKAKWTEFDFEGRLWTIPPERSKRKGEHGNKSHVVPLTETVIALVRSMETITGGATYVFSSSKGERPLSNEAMANLVDRMGYGADGEKGKITVHRFRSTFDNWVSETTTHENIVKEMALGHVIEDKTERSYRRGILLEKRIALMRDWEINCDAGA
jgi:integrase